MTERDKGKSRLAESLRDPAQRQTLLAPSDKRGGAYLRALRQEIELMAQRRKERRP